MNTELQNTLTLEVRVLKNRIDMLEKLVAELQNKKCSCEQAIKEPCIGYPPSPNETNPIGDPYRWGMQKQPPPYVGDRINSDGTAQYNTTCSDCDETFNNAAAVKHLEFTAKPFGIPIPEQIKTPLTYDPSDIDDPLNRPLGQVKNPPPRPEKKKNKNPKPPRR